MNILTCQLQRDKCYNNTKLRQTSVQCDQIGQFIALWANFQRLWQQFFVQIAHILESFIFQVKSFLGNFYRHLATFICHVGHIKLSLETSKIATRMSNVNENIENVERQQKS